MMPDIWILMHLVGVLDKFENGWHWPSFKGDRGQNVLFSTTWWIKLLWPNLLYMDHVSLGCLGLVQNGLPTFQGQNWLLDVGKFSYDDLIW